MERKCYIGEKRSAAFEDQYKDQQCKMSNESESLPLIQGNFFKSTVQFILQGKTGKMV